MSELESTFNRLFDFHGNKRPAVKVAPAPVEEDSYGKGKVMILKGKQVEFFTIGVLANALNRQQVTIRSWEDDGRLPRARYRADPPARLALENKKRMGKRLYTRSQIDAVVAAAKLYGVLENKPDADWKAFTKAVASAWRTA